MTDKWDQFAKAPPLGQLAVDPRMVALWGQKIGSMPGEITDAMERLLGGSYRPGSGEDQPIADALATSGAAFTGGLGRAALSEAAGELGATGAQIMRRSDVRAAILKAKADGLTSDKIADMLNERFAPLLDEGEVINGRAVRGRMATKDFELGATGGQGSTPGTRVTSEMVKDWLEKANVPLKREYKSGGTTYLEIEPREGVQAITETPTVRIPDDGHIGKPLRRKEVGNRFDTGDVEELKGAARRDPVDTRGTTNVSGEPYADWPNLEAALKKRLGASPDGNFLTPPDKSPHPRPPLRDGYTPPPGPDPRQLKLLSGGIPVTNNGGGETTIAKRPIETPDVALSDAGRFARPQLETPTPDGQLIRDTQDLTARVAALADDTDKMTGASKFSRQVSAEPQSIKEESWPDFLRVLKAIQSMGTYEPDENARESTNVEDQRRVPWGQFMRRAGMAP